MDAARLFWREVVRKSTRGFGDCGQLPEDKLTPYRLPAVVALRGSVLRPLSLDAPQSPPARQLPDRDQGDRQIRDAK